MLLYFLLCLVYGNAPNIILFIADDLGWDDVGYHNSVIPTPTIDMLVNNGVELNNYYVATTCTPSRASLLTGKYPVNTGLNSALFYNSPYGLENHKTIATEFKELNYSTSFIGKWHLGFAKPKYTPVRHGFDYFYGIYGGATNYRTKQLNDVYDLHRYSSNNKQSQLTSSNISYGHIHNETHSTLIYTDEVIRIIRKDSPFFVVLSYQAGHTPLQPIQSTLKRCTHIVNRFRKKFCGLIVGIDDSMQKIVYELQKNSKWFNTIIVFTTDNGGQPWFGASNYPYRGTKNSLYQGGVKGIGFISGGYVLNKRKTEKYNGLMHISDWYPTLLSFVSHKKNIISIHDGYNMENNILNDWDSPRYDALLHNDVYSGSIAYINGKYKYIKGNAGDDSKYGKYDGRYYLVADNWVDRMVYFLTNRAKEKNFFINEILRELRNFIKSESIGLNVVFNLEPPTHVRLYDLEKDPYEHINIANRNNKLIDIFTKRIEELTDEHQYQYKWFLMDQNNTFDSANNKKYFTYWLDNNYEIIENDLVDCITQYLLSFVYVVLSYMLLLIFIICLIPISCRRKKRKKRENITKFRI